MQRQERKHTRAPAHHPNRSQGLRRGSRRGGHPGGRGAGPRAAPGAGVRCVCLWWFPAVVCAVTPAPTIASLCNTQETLWLGNLGRVVQCKFTPVVTHVTPGAAATCPSAAGVPATVCSLPQALGRDGVVCGCACVLTLLLCINKPMHGVQALSLIHISEPTRPY